MLDYSPDTLTGMQNTNYPATLGLLDESTSNYLFEKALVNGFRHSAMCYLSRENGSFDTSSYAGNSKCRVVEP